MLERATVETNLFQDRFKSCVLLISYVLVKIFQKMKTQLYFLFLLVGFLGLGNVVTAQNTLPCGTVADRYYMDNLAMAGINDRSAPIQRVFKKLSITAHIVRDSLGEAAHTESSILGAIEGLNGLFDPIKISFEVCDFRYIDNYNFFDLVREEEHAEMLIVNYEPNTINMYFVNSIEIDGLMAGGYAALPGGQDFAVIASLGSIPHEMGHFFGLLHTFEGGGVELADGSNCETEGDLVCDTEADPYYPMIPMDPENPCNIFEDLVDANGQYYVPPTNNIMSYYSCGCKFTPGQYNRMVDQFLAIRSYLW